MKLWENTLVRIGAAGAGGALIFSGIVWFWSSFIPAAANYQKSDPPPLVGQERLKRDELDIAQNFKLLYAQQQKLARRQDKAELEHNIERRSALARDMDQLRDDIKHHPSDTHLGDDLTREQEELNGLNDDYACLKYGKCKTAP